MKEKYVLFGVSGFLSDIIDVIHANDGRVTALYMNMPEVKRDHMMGLRERLALLDYPVDVHESLESFEPQPDVRYALGTPAPHRHRLVEELKKTYSLTFGSLIHPTAFLGSNVRIGEGVFVNVNATVGPNAILDDFCTMNRCVSIGHETRIGKHALIGPNATIAGSVTVGDCATVAMMATIIDKVRVGAWTFVGAASLVTKDLPERVVAFGVPARIVRDNRDADYKNYMDRRTGLQ